MAAPAPTRWPRTGDPPTSPFRPSRGAASGPLGRARGAPGSRGPRGAGRAPSTDDDPPKPSTTTSPLASKPKPPSSRRSSRAVPPPVQTHLPAADVPPAPHSARPSSTRDHRRRRSTQASKTPAQVPPSIHAPAPSDALLRPGRPRLPAVPHTAPIKDTPPHLRPTAAANLAPRTDIRTDIDALVERVRASAMDHHRPSTPGSHIDWAGDDDDSLPDLDDWGVSPAVFAAAAAAKSDTISPIIVDGLRPLPDLAPQSYHASPLQREVSPPPVFHVAPEVQGTASEKEPTPEASPVDTKPAVSNNNGRRPLHPSLPAKPSTVLAVAPPKSVAAATPMRIASYPNAKSVASETPSVPAQVDTTPPAAGEVPDEPVAGEEKADDIVKATTTTIPEKENALREDSTATTRPASAVQPPRDPIDDVALADGLGASIHAPRPSTHNAAGHADAVRSAPAAVASFADVRALHSAPPPGHSHAPTHTRAHTVGRGPMPGGSGARSPGMRAGRGGGRGGGGGGGEGGGAHLRNHSSPAAAGSYRSAHAHARPVLTGAALSLLSRTIVGGGGSPSKSQTVTPLGD